MQEHPIVVDHRRRRVPPDVQHIAGIVLPQQLASVVVTEQASGTVPHNHPLAISDRGRRAVGVGLVRRLDFAKRHDPLPDFLARLAVETVKATLFSIHAGTGQEHPPS